MATFMFEGSAQRCTRLPVVETLNFETHTLCSSGFDLYAGNKSKKYIYSFIVATYYFCKSFHLITT